MAGFCPQCGRPLDPQGECPDVECASQKTYLARPAPRAIDLPRAPLGRRAGAAGLEMGVLLGLDLIGLLLAPFTFTIAGMITGLVGAGYTAVRDLEQGRFSLGKHIAHLRVVDQVTLQPASNKQGLIRNSYFVAFWLLAALPDLIGWVGWVLMILAAFLDLAMAAADPKGRRLGDRLAGTQVVPVERA